MLKANYLNKKGVIVVSHELPIVYFLEDEDLPAWYELGLIENGQGVCLRIHQEANHLLSLLSSETPLIRSLQESSDLGLSRFIPPTEKSWGFGEVLCFDGRLSDKEWFAYQIDFSHRQGKSFSTRPEIRDISATLNIAFVALGRLMKRTSATQKQLLAIEMTTHTGIYGGAISATIPPQLCRWINAHPNNTSFKEAEFAMRNTTALLSGERNNNFVTYSTRAELRQPKWINLTTIGDACGLDPNDYWDKSLEKGYKLTPHNTDSPSQQLILFSGLCALHDCARRDGY